MTRPEPPSPPARASVPACNRGPDARGDSWNDDEGDEMTEAKHTPGPWTAKEWEREKGGLDWNVWGPKSSNHIGADYDRLAGDYGSEADARLIAAAPDLLEALDGQVRNCPLCRGEGKAVHAVEFITGTNKKKDCSWCSAGRAAIARARGEPK